MNYSDATVSSLFTRSVVKLANVPTYYAHGWVLDLSHPISQHSGDVVMIYPRGRAPMPFGRPPKDAIVIFELEAAE